MKLDPKVAVYYFDGIGGQRIIDIVPRSYFVKYNLVNMYQTLLPQYIHRIHTVNFSLFKERYGK